MAARTLEGPGTTGEFYLKDEEGGEYERRIVEGCALTSDIAVAFGLSFKGLGWVRAAPANNNRFL